jgi:hypothetical protein
MYPEAIGIAVVLLMLALTCLWLVGGGHLHLLGSMFGAKPPTGTQGDSSGDVSNFVKQANYLAHDSQLVIVPGATLAGGVGGTMWALGHRRGPGVVGGAVAAGTLGLLAPKLLS